MINNGKYSGSNPSGDIPGDTTGYSGYSQDVGFRIFTFGLNNNGWNYGTNAVYGRYNTIFALGAGSIASYSAFLSPIEALSLDKKIDDSKPGTGSLLADNGADTGGLTCRRGGTQAK